MIGSIAAATGVALAAVVVDTAETSALAASARGEEGADREINTPEEIAGAVVVDTAGCGAVLIRDAVADVGDAKLCVALHADNGELPEGDIEPTLLAGSHKVGIEAACNECGDIHAAAVIAAAVTNINNLACKDDGVNNFHDCLGLVAAHKHVTVTLGHSGFAGENFCVPFAAAEDDTLGEHSKTAECTRTGSADDCVNKDAVIVSNVDGVVTCVKLNRLYLDRDVQKLRAARLNIAGLIERALGILRQINAKILDAVFVIRGCAVEDFKNPLKSGVSGYRLVCDFNFEVSFRGFLLLGVVNPLNHRPQKSVATACIRCVVCV